MYAPIVEKRPELEAICRQRGVRELEVFGSAATGRFDPETSDLDFLVEFEPAAPAELADRYFGLLEDLQALFGHPVDLLTRPSLKNPYFLEGIRRSRTLLYAG
jgi:uncharacterized protein